MVRIGVLVSGGGTNLQALINAKNRGALPDGELAVVISSKEGAFALERAQKAGIATAVVARQAYASREAFDHALLETLAAYRIQLVILAGFMCILSPQVIEAYRDRIINVHPSLIPSFCGEGYYGLRVHEAALGYGVKVTGATVHLVNEVPDGGRILLQKAVDVQKGDTPQTLQQRVMEEAEWILLPQAAAELCKVIRKEEAAHGAH